MTQRNRFYVLAALSGEPDEDYRKLETVAQELRIVGGNDEEVFGFSVALIRSPEDFAEHQFDERLYTARTQGKLPILCVGVAYVVDRFDISRLAPIVERFGLELLLEST
jgi:hypothetical protein